MPAKKLTAQSKKKKNADVDTKVVKGKKTTTLSIPVYSLAGIKLRSLSLPKEIFGAKVNKPLLAQAIRVYLNMQKAHRSNTKSRSEVKGSTRKIWSQKGTGRARHGARTAPIFVGGGVALGPKFRKKVLTLPKKMKKAALISALSQRVTDREVLGIGGVEKATGKSKEVAQLVKKLNKTSVLIAADGKVDQIQRATRNIAYVTVLPVNLLNSFEVMRYQTLMLTKGAIVYLEDMMRRRR